MIIDVYKIFKIISMMPAQKLDLRDNDKKQQTDLHILAKIQWKYD